MRLVDLVNEVMLREKLDKKKFKIQDLDDFLKDEGVKLEEAKLGSDIPMKDYPEEELKGNLQRSEDKEKLSSDKYKQPRIHGSTAQSIRITDMSDKEYDLDKLKAMITTPPTKILKKNEKMKNSLGEDVQFYNLGLPAIKGLLFDEDDQKFKIVSTCPMAGACQQFCYAHKGGYIQYKASSESTTRLLNFLINHPDQFEAMLSKELAAAVKSAKGTKVILRWHDTGDFFSASYKDLAFSIARKHPDVKFYAYTKDSSAESGAPDNFVFNFSEGAKPSETKKVDFDTTKNSRVVPKSLFWEYVVAKGAGLVKDSDGRMQYKSAEALEEFKKKVAEKYKRDIKDIILYKDLMKKPEGKEMVWSVIVAAGDGDDAATRRDVRDTLLLAH